MKNEAEKLVSQCEFDNLGGDEIDALEPWTWANAETTEGLAASNLVVSVAMVDEGPTMKRWRPRAQGRATRINKRTSHITLVVQPADVVKSKNGRGA